ncbi:MAG: aminotransferase class V-fold PLP-dependent enzyme [Clostridiales bacterium]|nr:aminotransferase class V-fold PLP-dependent enzyme [Clostridiales bacterium]
MSGLFRDSFPFFKENPDSIYFDSASTSQKLKTSIDAMSDFYSKSCSNIGRASYRLSNAAGMRVEEVRSRAAEYIGCEASDVIFTKSATESSNLVCRSFLPVVLHEGDNVLTSSLEHNSAFLPLKTASERAGAHLRVISPGKDDGIDPDEFEKSIDSNTKAAVFTCASNVSSTKIDYTELCRICREKGVISILDATQLLAHKRINVKSLGCDFLFFSAHKMYSLSGCGILYAKREHIDAMEPLLYGGGIVETLSPLSIVSGNRKFEAGSPDVGSIIAFGAALDFLFENQDAIPETERKLCKKLREGFEDLKDKCRLIGKADSEIPVASFTVPGISDYDITSYLGASDISVRSGRMCAHTLFDALGIDGCIRVSLGCYNTEEEISRFFDCLNRILKKFSV